MPVPIYSKKLGLKISRLIMIGIINIKKKNAIPINMCFLFCVIINYSNTSKLVKYEFPIKSALLFHIFTVKRERN